MIARTLSLTLSLAAACVVGATLMPADAYAQAADKQAEKFRLTEEMKRLAQRNAWAGVEAKYEELLALNVPLDFETHTLAAQSARTIGKTYEQYMRLERAKDIEADDEVLAEMAAIDAAYGRVRLVGNERWEVALARPAMPFAPDERKSVEYAIRVAMESGGFEGMLPQGDYIIGGEQAKEKIEFTVAPGPDWQEIVLTSAHSETTEGLVVYHGPVVLVGYSLTSTPEPTEPVLDSEGVHQGVPATLGGSGFSVEAGYEIGFTREFAVSLTFDYRNMNSGGNWLHSYSGFLAALVRPGELRVGVGPVWGRWGGQGSGVPAWFDVGHDQDNFPNDSIDFDGESFAAGVKLTASYGLLDFEPFRGVPELWAVWQTDGPRNFFGAGVRVGLVPEVPRFED